MGARDEALAVLRKAPRRLLEELNRQPTSKICGGIQGFRGLLLTAPAQ